MANIAQDHVHRLIRSMTRPEKRYFKVYTSRHLLGGQSNHHTLFDAIAAMEVYDEQELHRKFGPKAFMRRFSVTKRRLYEAILQSLDAYHAESSTDARLRRMLHQVEILYDRALYADAEKMLRSVRTLAREHGKHAVLLEVAQWQQRTLERNNYSGVSPDDLREFAEETRRTQAERDEIDVLWQLKSQAFLLLFRGGQAREQAALDEARALLEHPLLQDTAVLATPKARFLRHHVLSALAFVRNDLQACERHLTGNAALLTQDPKWFHDEPNLALGVLSNQAHVRMRLGRYAEAMEGLKEFKRLPLMMPQAPSPDLEMKLFTMGTGLELTVLSRMGAFDKAMERLSSLDAGLARYADRLSVIRRAGLLFQAAYACFGAGQPDKALRWCHRLLNEPGIDAHSELHAVGRMLNLMVLLELGKNDLLPYAVRNTERALRSRERFFRFEEILLAYVHERLRPGRGRDVRTLDQQLHHDLTALAQDPLERSVLEHFDPVAWAGARASGRPFAEWVKERASARPPAPAPSRRKEGPKAA